MQEAQPQHLHTLDVGSPQRGGTTQALPVAPGAAERAVPEGQLGAGEAHMRAWGRMGVHGSAWECMGVHESAWECMGTKKKKRWGLGFPVQPRHQ